MNSGDFGFVGPAYTAPSIYQDDQELINWYLERDPLKADGDRGQYAMYPTPGLTLKCTPAVGEVRAMRSVLGGTVLLAIVGNTLYSITSAYAATAVGTLTTSTGPLNITDNGTAAYFCDVNARYSYTFSGSVFAIQTDGGFTGGGRADVIDGFIVYPQPGTQQWGATSFNSVSSIALSVGLKNGAPDNIVSLIVNNREVFLLGESTGEVWQDVGAFPFPFLRIPGTSMQHGVAAVNTVAPLGNSFAFVSQDRRGQGVVVVMNGYQPVEISNHAVTTSIANRVISDAMAYTYQLAGHEFYVVTFPSIDTTWVYDAATQLWHKWMSFSGGAFHRHRSNCQCLFQGLVLVGDYQNGRIYALDNDVFTDNGATIKRLRRCPHLVSDFNQGYFSALQIQFQPGVGLASGQGSDPEAMLRWSNDGGSTWSNEHWRTIGKVGKYRHRAIWRRLGIARDRVFEVSITDPVKAVIVSANLIGAPGDN